MNELRELSLFSGYGGLSLGLKLAGLNIRTVMYVEYERYPQEILKARIKDGALDDAPIWADISTFRGEQLRGLVDVITAGWPCPPFSVAGKRLGSADPRNMWGDTLRAIREVQPRWVLLENVVGLLSSTGVGDMESGDSELGDATTGTPGYAATVVGQLTSAGYECRWQVVGADDVGAPHRRKRWFCWAVADSSGSRTWVETHRDSGQGRQFAHPQQSTVLRQEHRSVSTEGTHTNIPNVADANSYALWHGQQLQGERRPASSTSPITQHDGEAGLLDDPQPVRLTGSQEPRGTSWGPRGETPVGEGREGGSRLDQRDTELGDTQASGFAWRQREECTGGAEPNRPGEGQGMADPKIEGLEGVWANSHQEGRQESNGSVGYRSRTIPTWPPRPSDAEGWARVLAERPDLAPALSQEASQQQIRGVASGPTSRVGELKALGNGVIPAVVAAFLRRQFIREGE